MVSPEFPQNISPGGSLNVTVRFSPTEAKSYTGTLTISSNDPDQPEVSVSLRGEAMVFDLALYPDDISFHGITLENEVLAEANRITIAAKVHNKGNIEATDIHVKFSDETADTIVGVSHLEKLEPDGSAYVDIIWTLSSDVEAHRIQVEVAADRQDSKPEDNVASRTVSVYYADGEPFSLNVDAYSFRNDKLTDYLSGPEPGILGSFVRPKYLFTLTGIIASQKADGYCAGMSSTSILYKQYPQLKPGGEDEKVWDMKMEDPKVTEKIKEYQSRSVIFDPRLLPGINDPQREYNRIKGSLPAMLIMRSGVGIFGSVHAVVAYRIIDSGTERRVYIYDPNFPLNERGINPDAASYVTFYDDKFIGPRYEIPSAAGFSPVSVYNVDYKYVIAKFPTPTDPDEEQIRRSISEVSDYITGLLIDRDLAAVMFACPVTAILTDQHGRRIGYTEGGFVNDIPGATVEVLSDVTIYYVPADLSYGVEATGTESGSLDLCYIVPKEGGIVEVAYEDVPVDTGTKVSINLGRQVTDYTMEIDSDGDGITDSTKEADYHSILTITPPTGGALRDENVYAYPNPFDPEKETVKIRFSLSKSGNVTMKLYDSGGNLVRTLAEGRPMEARMEQSVTWDGRNEEGDVVANGVYFCVISTDKGERAVCKVAVLR